MDQPNAFPVQMMRSNPHLFLLLTAAFNMMSCAGQRVAPPAENVKPPTESQASEGADAPVADVVDAQEARDAYWRLAMERYKPSSDEGLATTTVDEEPATERLEPEATVPSTPVVSSAVTAAPEKQQPLDPSKVPFAIRVRGKLGLVKSPYDPTGQLIDVQDFEAGQMARCPYSGKVFRVPP